MTRTTEQKTETKLDRDDLITDASKAQEEANNTFSDQLLTSAAWLTMVEEMPEIADKIDAAERTMDRKANRTNILAFGFIAEYNELRPNTSYSLDRDDVRQYVYAAAKRTAKKKEVCRSKGIKMVTSSFTARTTRAVRDAMLAYQNVNQCELSEDGKLVAPANVILEKITIKETDPETKKTITLKNQPNPNSDLTEVPNTKAQTWAKTAGIVASTGTNGGDETPDVSLVQMRDGLNLLLKGLKAMDLNLAEQEILREVAATAANIVNVFDCADPDGGYDYEIFSEMQKSLITSGVIKSAFDLKAEVKAAN